MSEAPKPPAGPEGTAHGADAARPEVPPAPAEGYSRYVLAVLVLVYVLNFLDRQIITILAEDIKADLGISDAEIGFLYGTAFAVFYAVFGIPLGRLADVWNRRTLISLGLSVWSLMTAVSGLAKSFPQLAGARIGVGVGEASATPAAFSMLTDSFPRRLRATVLAVYSSGIYLGAGLGLAIGGQIVDRWNHAFPAGDAPFGLAGWQAAYLAVGLPGLLLALWVRSLREPPRGAIDGIYTPPEPHPFRQFFFELRSVVPPFTILHLARHGAGARGVIRNLSIAAIVSGLASWLIQLTGHFAQWFALGTGLYAAASWAQAIGLRDRPTATLLFGGRAFLFACVGFSFLAFTGYGLGGWGPVFFMRIHGQSSGDVGAVVGLTAAAGGLVGVMLGGHLADRFRRRSPLGRIQVGYLTAIASIPFSLWMLNTASLTTAYLLNFPVSIAAAMWIGAGASTVQELVLPRMRAVASAFYIMVVTFVGLALGPYTIGRLSDVLGDLRLAMMLGLLANGLAVIFLWLASRHVAVDEEMLLVRARAAGEPVEAT